MCIGYLYFLVDDIAVFLGAAGQFLQEHYGEEVNVLGIAGAGDQAIVRPGTASHGIVLDLRMPGMTSTACSVRPIR